MRLIVITTLAILCSGAVYSQRSEIKYVHGTLSGLNSYTGYFWFDPSLTQMGQRIFYKETPDAKKKKTLFAKDFDTFKGDSIFLRTFKTIPYGTGRLEAMIPRIVTGKLELYSASWRGYYSFTRADHFYIYDGRKEIRLVRRKFKEQIDELLSADVEVLSEIERRGLTYDDMPEIIHNYNRRKAESKSLN